MNVKRNIIITILLLVVGASNIIIGEEVIYEDIGFLLTILGGAMIALAVVGALFIALYRFYPPDPPNPPLRMS